MHRSNQPVHLSWLLFAVWFCALLECLAGCQRIDSVAIYFFSSKSQILFLLVLISVRTHGIGYYRALPRRASLCARVLFAVRICMEIICIPSLGQQAGRTLNRVGIHLCCRVLQLPLSNWEKRVCVCVCTLACNTGPSQHVWPCSCSRANFSPGCAYASVPPARPMRGERMRSQWNPAVTIVCTHPSFSCCAYDFFYSLRLPRIIWSLRFTTYRLWSQSVSVCDLSALTCCLKEAILPRFTI